jgi:diguanylate cyclase (GGDEF)-like protein
MKILVVDDEAAMRDAYRQVLEARLLPAASDIVSRLASDLFGDDDADADAPQAAVSFAVEYAAQGEDAVRMVEAAHRAGTPFKVAFIDIRMPPGIDGRETARRIRAIDSHINLVIVSAYSDHSVTDIAATAGPPDKLFYISKPFAAEEVRQMATALCRRWDHDTGQVELLHQKMAELVASEARAHHAATHDFLTGAPNRLAFFNELTRLAASDRTRFSLALIDLDRFKHVNDTFGHGAGDDLLIAVYELLRAAAPPDAFIARIGGDEFGLILQVGDQAQAERICGEITAACSRSFTIFGNSVRIGASCGLLLPADYPSRDVMELIRCADLALFAAKQKGRGMACLFDNEMDESQRFRRDVEDGVRTALERGELEVHYQPIVERDSLTVVGFEALLRWTSPEHGVVSPSVFIPIAEESRLIDDLGEWVVDQALHDSLAWPDLFVSINFSPRQFRRLDFLPWLDSRVKKWGIDPRKVQIEVTETAIFEDVERATEQLREIEARGYRIALDDFGTGYSSLFNIKNFSLSCIKIDKSFIDGLGKDRHSTAIVGSVIHLAKSLGLSVVAEGVESEAQCQMLRMSGCSHLQGFLFGRAEAALIALDQLNGDRSIQPLRAAGNA